VPRWKWQPVLLASPEFVAGTGGHEFKNFIVTDSSIGCRYDTAFFFFWRTITFAVEQQWSWFQFINPTGQTLDSGAIPRSGAPADVTVLSTPTNLTATTHSASQTDLSWGIFNGQCWHAGHDIYR